MKITKNNQSAIDYLFQTLPQFQSIHKNTTQNVDDNTANILYSLWRTSENKKSNTVYQKPVTMSWYDVKKLESQGVVKRIQDNIEITAKGQKVLRILILGNNNSIFDKDSIINYSTALSQITQHKQANKKIASKQKQHWWDKFLKK